MLGRPGVTYESAQTRKYQLGRTEVIRSASKESKAWAEAMLDPKQQVRPSLTFSFFLFKPHPFSKIRTPTTYVPYSLVPPADISNMPHGQPTAKVSIVISSVSRKC